MTVATESLVANPVAICLDEHQNLYIAETFRQSRGVEDNRGHSEWLLDDLAAQTVDDRRAYITKHAHGSLDHYTSQSERIRRLTDDDGDRVMDRAAVFAEGFNDVVDGTGADVRVRDGDVYYTCIPSLWRLRDADRDGKSDQRESLLSGFGVRFAFRGHDLHGLRFGPDGRLYFSIGDRGFNVTTREGKDLLMVDRGAVLRCEPDGSDLQIVASGLRNPQDLAFDELGNLFTCDNDSDHDDQCRLAYIVPGSDSGWRMYYQYLNDRGPWVREGLWKPSHAGQAAYILPPLANIADGPSGMAYYPGVGMSKEYAGHYFLADFRGGAADSGVLTFSLKPQGASFEPVGVRKLLWRILATDVEFASDGSLYVADWLNGWDGTGQGRVIRLWDPDNVEKSPLAADPRAFRAMAPDRLAELLAHPDQRVRQEAQFALADLGDVDTLIAIARNGSEQLARIHAIWAVGQIGRRHSVSPDLLTPLVNDPDAEIRAQTIKTLGDLPAAAELALAFVAALGDPSPRVQSFAAFSLARCHDPTAIQPLLDLLAANQGHDLVLRHAAVMGLTGQGDGAALEPYLTQKQPREARLGLLLALRRLGSPLVARFLNDADPLIVLEAARAMHDEDRDGELDILAAVDPTTVGSLPNETLDPLARRIINANFRLGRGDAVLEWAQFDGLPDELRRLALESLLDWADPSVLDKVTGEYSPLAKNRDASSIAAALRVALPTWLEGDRPPDLAVFALAAKYRIVEATPLLKKLATRGELPADVRVAAVNALAEMNVEGLPDILSTALQDASPAVRVAALEWIAKQSKSADSLVAQLDAAMQRGAWTEQQRAVALLAACRCDAADAVLKQWLARLASGEAPPQIELELREAAEVRKLPIADGSAAAPASAADPLADYRQCLVGGDEERGRKIFRERGDLACSRCHILEPELTSVGPNLSQIGAAKPRDYLLEAVVDPNKAIATGFEMTVLVTDDGLTVSGIVKAENDDTVQLAKPDGTIATIDKKMIEERLPGLSAMPTDLGKTLSKRDLRDLVEFLAQQRGETGISPAPNQR